MTHTIMGLRGIITVDWIDSGHEPQLPPDPLFPNGRTIDISKGGSPTCTVSLPYPAKRCGQFLIICSGCGTRTMLSTAGRPDDPRSLRMPCRREGMQ
jgi:hypothetical protein